MLEHNFALFFGLSVQLYEMTLISDDAPIDRFFEGQQGALTAKERRGLAIFNSETADTACSGCHSGAELFVPNGHSMDARLPGVGRGRT